MAGWLGSFVLRRVTAIHQRELEREVNVLRGMDASELGLLLAFAAHVRNGAPILCEALLDLNALGDKRFAMLSFTLSKTIQELQKKKDSPDAAAWMIWLHTARAGQDPALRFLAKQMWAELERGFSHVVDAATDFRALTNQSWILPAPPNFRPVLTRIANVTLGGSRPAGRTYSAGPRAAQSEPFCSAAH